MKRQYPFYVLFLEIPKEAVDVNVHPNKSDVRFENNQVVYGCIYSVISSVLDGNASAIDYIVSDSDKTKSIFSEEMLGKENAGKATGGGELSKTEVKAGPDIYTKYPAPTKEMREGYRIEFHDSGVAGASAKASFADTVFPEVLDTDKVQNGEKREKDAFTENKQFLEMLDKKAQQEKIIFENAVFKGSLFNTYLIYEEGDNAFIIDQHAAHERLIFDKLSEEMRARKVVRQSMLVPFVLSVNREETAFLSDNLESIFEIGFDIEEFGTGSFKISAVPVDLQDIDLTAFFADLLSEVGNLRGIKLHELLRDKIAMTACKHAIKGGMMLTDSEKQKLFAMLHGNMGLKCTHGRPVAVKLSKYEIEKMFKRIV